MNRGRRSQHPADFDSDSEDYAYPGGHGVPPPPLVPHAPRRHPQDVHIQERERVTERRGPDFLEEDYRRRETAGPLMVHHRRAASTPVEEEQRYRNKTTIRESGPHAYHYEEHQQQQQRRAASPDRMGLRGMSSERVRESSGGAQQRRMSATTQMVRRDRSPGRPAAAFEKEEVHTRVVEESRPQAPQQPRAMAPAPQLPRPHAHAQVIPGPIIERQVVTHYTDVDHGVIVLNPPPPPPPQPTLTTTMKISEKKLSGAEKNETTSVEVERRSRSQTPSSSQSLTRHRSVSRPGARKVDFEYDVNITSGETDWEDEEEEYSFVQKKKKHQQQQRRSRRSSMVFEQDWESEYEEPADVEVRQQYRIHAGDNDVTIRRRRSMSRPGPAAQDVEIRKRVVSHARRPSYPSDGEEDDEEFVMDYVQRQQRPRAPSTSVTRRWSSVREEGGQRSPSRSRVRQKTTFASSSRPQTPVADEEDEEQRLRIHIRDGHGRDIDVTKSRRAKSNKPDMWTELSKRLVCAEAVRALGYDFLDAGDLLIIKEYLEKDQISELAQYTGDFRAEDRLRRRMSLERKDPAAQKTTERVTKVTKKSSTPRPMTETTSHTQETQTFGQPGQQQYYQHTQQTTAAAPRPQPPVHPIQRPFQINNDPVFV